MFFVQLRLLIWKNFIIRKRSKIRVGIELISPLVLFLILIAVRSRGLKEYRHECFFEEKALPSSGFIQFYQSLLCTLNNTCYKRPPVQNQLLHQELDYRKIHRLVIELESIAKKQIKQEHKQSAEQAAKDILSGLTLLLKNVNSSSQKLIPMRNIVKPNALLQLTKNRNLTREFTSSLLASQVAIPNLESLQTLRKKPKALLCNSSYIEDVVIGLKPKFFGNLTDLLCLTSGLDLFRVVDFPAMSNELLKLIEQDLGTSFHPSDWSNMFRLISTLQEDIRRLDSLSDLLKEMMDIRTVKSLVKLTNSSMNSSSILDAIGELVCGRSSLPSAEQEMSFEIRERNRMFKMAKSVNEFGNRSYASSLTPECIQLINILESSLDTRLIWRMFKPFIIGKIIYTPNIPVIADLMENANKSFTSMLVVQQVVETWLDIISPFIRDIIDGIDSIKLLNVTENVNISIPGIDNIINNILGNSNQIIDSLKEFVDQMDKIASTVLTYSQCVNLNKFEGYSNESDALERARSLMYYDELWAVLVFHNNSWNITNQLPQHVVYTIRMDSQRVDSTKKIRDVLSSAIPRQDPRIDQKYFTSGFIFLQDIIEQTIIKMQTGRQQLPAIYTQQFPSSCYIYDTFFMSISLTFPLFMILSFVYTCAMIVKSIVHEKEKRLKETMKTMGLSNTVHWVAWFVDSILSMTIVCVILSCILVFGKVTENSDPVVVFIFVFSFCIATICKSFLISTFFSRANLAAACGGLLYFICFLPYNFIVLDDRLLTDEIQIGSSLLSNVAFGFGCMYFAYYERMGEGVQFSNLAISPIENDGYSLLGCIGMMLLDAVIYLLFTWYIEAVFPGQYGVPKPWYFFLQRSYWCGDNRTNKVSIHNVSGTTTTREFMENEPTSLQVGISIRNLSKTYSNGKVALQNLNLRFYEGQITAFLGHNGAGKTTTISILTGLYPPSSGSATVNGYDIQCQIDRVRQVLGLCPQHNVLFEQLTVQEHMEFYSWLKRKESGKMDSEIAMMISDIGLSNKIHDKSCQLSGGMKRRLSIGVAFIGGSKTVILDEPTSGVDPYSRRAIWDLLLKYKQGRTIVLTTHFMDEADLLGDRIAVIAQGQLKCCGSSLFLKQKFGSGYYLSLVSHSSPSECSQDSGITDSESMPKFQSSKEESNCRAKFMESVIKQYITNAALTENVGSDLVFCLPEKDIDGNDQKQQFSRLFQHLDSNLNALGYSSYGVSDTTLEEIFLKVASASFEQEDLSLDDPVQDVRQDPTFLMENGTDHEVAQTETTQTFNSKPLKKLRGRKLFQQQMQALYVKRFHYSRRNFKGLFCEIILPVIFITIALASTKLVLPIQSEPPLVLTPWLYGENNVGFFAKNNSSDWFDVYIDELLNGTGMGARCLAGEPLGLNCSSDDIGQIIPPLDPENYEDIECPCINGAHTCGNSSGLELESFRAVTSDVFYNLTGRDIGWWIIRSHKELFVQRNGGYELTVKNPLSKLNMSLFIEDVKKLSSAAQVDTGLGFINNFGMEIMNWLNHTNIFASYDSIKVWFNNKAWASSVAYLNAINNVILRSSLPSVQQKDEYGITVINHPMNYSDNEIQRRIMQNSPNSLLHAISVIFAMSFVPASFVVFLVEERISKAKHLQFVSGVSPFRFWLAAYTWDLLNYTISCILCVCVFLAFNEEAYVSERNIPGLILLLFLYGVSAIPLMYPASLIFSVPSSAFVVLACLNLFVGVVSTISTFVLEIFNDEELNLIGSTLKKVFLILPHYCLGRGLIDMANIHIRSLSLQVIGMDLDNSIFDWDYLGRNIFCLILQGFVFFSFNLMLHYQFSSKKCLLFGSKFMISSPDHSEDEDVAKERERVEKMGSEDVLRISNLSKVYRRRKVPAVDKLSFGLTRGECFGLLGVNGAGKSTTFKMLTGDIDVSYGDASLDGYWLTKDLNQVRQNIGYCPQEDALLSLLTGDEHLRLFARLRGIPSHSLDMVVGESLKKLDLLAYKNRCAGTYSGGNKRKLSTAIALIGDPSVIFLDEPSSGMDPKARRSLWEVILDSVRNNRGVLLTSHSMEECQALCTRLGIMVNGKLKCLGTPQHLKNRFGSGYLINVRCENAVMSQVIQQVAFRFPKASLREKRYNQIVWHLPPNILSVSELFDSMESIRSVYEIHDYSISQTTLDDVFIRFASQQRETSDEVTNTGEAMELNMFHGEEVQQ